MAQFCTRCGKPLSPDVRFCSACGGAVANATAPTPTQPVSSMPSQQAAQFTPVTASEKRDPVTFSASPESASIADKWTAAAAPPASEASPSAPSSQFAPVDISAAPAPASTPVSSPGWEDVAAVSGAGNATVSGQQAAFSPAPSSSTPPDQQWSQTPPAASTASQQWSQTTGP